MSSQNRRPVAVALTVGLPLGLVSGFFGGSVDKPVMRGIEVILSFPTLVMALGSLRSWGRG